MNWDALDTLIGVVAAAVIAITGVWAQRRTSREQTDLARKEWQETLELQGRHVDVLEARITDIQNQLNHSHEALQRVQRQAQRWSERNAQYFEMLQDYRSRLARYGEQTPEINGEIGS